VKRLAVILVLVGLSCQPEPNLSGTWDYWITQGGEQKYTGALVLLDQGGRISGEGYFLAVAVYIDGLRNEHYVHVTVFRMYPDPGDQAFTITAYVEGHYMVGNIYESGFVGEPFDAKRR